MPDHSQPSEGSFFYKGIEIRRIPETGFVSISDLWKSEGQPWAKRPDVWAKRKENQRFLESVIERSGSLPWSVLKGGSSLQGTFTSPEIAVRYARSLSEECGEWLCETLDLPASIGKAKRESIDLGDRVLEVFQLPSGEYKLSQTQVAEAIGGSESNVRGFLASKSLEALPYKGFKPEQMGVEGERVWFNAIPIDLAISYWTKEARADNQVAISLLSASAKEAIERRADRAFGVKRTEEEYNTRFQSAFEKFAGFFPDYFVGSGSSVEAHSMVLAEQNLLRKLKRKFPKEIFSRTKSDVVQDLVLLGAQTDDWSLINGKAFPYPEGAANLYAYPDLISRPSECCVDGKMQRVVLLFQYVETIVDEKYVKDCFYLREYIDLVKKHYKADHSLLFFVSPYGVTRYAAACIKEKDELKSHIGVITVKQLAGLLFEKALSNKGDNIRRGRLRKSFRHLMEYKDLAELLSQEEMENVQSTSLPDIQLNLFSA